MGGPNGEEAELSLEPTAEEIAREVTEIKASAQMGATSLEQPRLNPLLMLGESRAPLEAASVLPSLPLLARAPRGDGHPVIVIPPFGAGDFLTTVARNYLSRLGYEAHRWGKREILALHRLATVAVSRLEEIYEASGGRKVSLVGHSLGGIYAREIARYSPDLVRSVITVGSPFAGDLKSNYVWPMYESVTGTRIKGMPSEFLEGMNQPPPVPSTAIYSKSDGVASWQSCVERTVGEEAENIEVQGSHIGLLHNPVVLYVVAERLAQPEGQWKPFDRSGWRSRFYGAADTTVNTTRLSAVETSFITAENNARPYHIGNLALFEPGANGPLTYDAVKDLIASRLELVPAFRRRIVEVPLGLDRPYAVDDDSLDLEFHIRQIGVPAPGGREQLADIVARLHARRLDRSRPLWEVYVLDGLEGDLVGLYTKVHFVAVDPMRGTEIMTALLDATPEGGSDQTPPEPRPPSRAPSQWQMLTSAGVSLVSRPRHLFWLQREMARRMSRSIADQMPSASEAYLETMRRTRGMGFIMRLMGDRPTSDDDDDYLSRPASRAPRVSFDRQITPHRRVGFASLPFDDLHAIKQAAGTTIHDVIMAVCAGGLRRWLDERKELPSEPLLAAVPVLVKGDENDRGLADHVSMMIAALPTNEADPVRRLERAHEAMRVAKERHDAIPATVLQDMTRYAPPAVAGLAARLVGATSLGSMASPPYNLTISNTPGPRHAVYCGGSRLVANYPLSVLSEGIGLHISLVTYDDKVHLGLVTCREALPSQWELVDDIVASLAELRAAVVGDEVEERVSS